MLVLVDVRFHLASKPYAYVSAYVSAYVCSYVCTYARARVASENQA